MKLKLNSKSIGLREGIKVIKLLLNRKHKAFLVGGTVRDQILKRDFDNVDIATSAEPDEVEQILTKSKIKTKDFGKKFGTILALVNQFPIEITTFRAEGRYSDKRHPDKVEFIDSFELDAKRRDFTVNAMYLDVVTGKVLDTVGGIKDIKGKLLRFVGDPRKRIDEDPLRMMRAARLATQLNFKIEKNSYSAIKVRAKLTQKVSAERVIYELDKIMASPNVASGLQLLDDLSLLKFIIPETQPIKTFSHGSRKYHLEGTMWDHTLLALKLCKDNNLWLRYALLFHDIGKPLVAVRTKKPEGWVWSTKGHASTSAEIFNNFALKFRLSNKARGAITWLIENHMLQNDFAQMSPGKQLALAEHPAFELLPKHWKIDDSACKRSGPDKRTKLLNKSLRAAKTLSKSLIAKQSVIKKFANAEWIMKHKNIKPGPQLGEVIKKVKQKIIFNKLKTAKQAKDFLKNT